MDESRFEPSQRTFIVLDRRSALRALAGGSVAALLASPGLAASLEGTPTSGEAQVPFLFLQSFGAGRLAAGANDTSTLTLSKNLDWTLYFSDRPDRQAGVMPTGDFMSMLAASHDNPPNAALVAHRASAGAGTEATIWIVTLVAGAYDAAADSLTYQVRIVQPADPGTEHFALTPTAGSAAAEELATGHLFIDPYTYHSGMIKPVNSGIVITRNGG